MIIVRNVGPAPEKQPLVLDAQFETVTPERPGHTTQPGAGGGMPGEIGGRGGPPRAGAIPESMRIGLTSDPVEERLLREIVPPLQNEENGLGHQGLPGPETYLPGTIPGSGRGGGGREGGGYGGGVGPGVGPGTQFFGAREHAHSFAYVIDRSGSMVTRGSLEVAKAELLASLAQLPPDAQFAIIFYNLDAQVLADREGRQGLTPATAANKEWARHQFATVVPDGGTDHMRALRKALAVKPEVIYFLTDADLMSNGDVDEILAEAGSTRVQAVEFGPGVDLGQRTPLARLAVATGGTYRYIDVSKFPRTAEPESAETATAVLAREARDLAPLVRSKLARDFLRATENLPAIAPRRLFRDEAKKTYLSESAAGSLSEQEKRTLHPVDVDESLYYMTKYGSPLAYVRPLDLLGESGLAGVSGLKMLDFGYGSVGHLRLLASLGADVTGIDVDPFLRALYTAPEDQGAVSNPSGRAGVIRLLDGRFPADKAVASAVGGSYDLIISKNTFKRGYVHPTQPVDPARLLNLGVEDAAFVKALYDALCPGGRVLIYNISPAPSRPGQPYKHWAEGGCPFDRAVWEAAGFRVIIFDRDDSDAIRKVAHALGWDQGKSAIDVTADLFAVYSLFEKPR
jgi:hypothetical protein